MSGYTRSNAEKTKTAQIYKLSSDEVLGKIRNAKKTLSQDRKISFEN